jgi:hypothetical protein
MFEFHGWANLKESPRDVDEGHLPVIVDEVRSEIESCRGSWGCFDLIVANGAYHVIASGYTNHRGAVADKLFALFRRIAAVAPGSYGLVHYLDDEDPDPGLRGQFRILVLSRGGLRTVTDSYLSPVVPKVEDPSVPSDGQHD